MMNIGTRSATNKPRASTDLSSPSFSNSSRAIMRHL